MTVEEIMARKAEIKNEVEAEGADLNALEEEVRNLNAELDTIKETAEKRQAVRDAVAMGEGEVTEKIEENLEERKMTNEEVRKSKEYVNAYANYIKTGDDKECRALLTELASGGVVPVPYIVEDRIREAWEKTGLMDRVRKSYIRGILKVGFEAYATPAAVHEEYGEDIEEEELDLGIVSLIPQSIKKWITISDEAMDLGGEEFLDYVYDEISYQIAHKAEDLLIDILTSAPATPGAAAAGVPTFSIASVALGDIAQALSLLADNATNPVVIMNKATWGAYMAAKYSASFAADPFEGLPVLFTSHLKSFATASSTDPVILVGDPSIGLQANFPNGAEITLKTDDLSLAERDLVKIVGRQYVGLGYVSNNSFVKITKA